MLDNLVKDIQMESIKQLARMMIEGKDIDEVDEDDELEDTGITPPSAAGGTGGDLGSMGATPSGGGKYPPGTAPTMPESLNNKGRIIENVDKDVAAMLNSLKSYDMLARSLVPANYIQEQKDAAKSDDTSTPDD